jgi:hypothetical protein
MCPRLQNGIFYGYGACHKGVKLKEKIVILQF